MFKKSMAILPLSFIASLSANAAQVGQVCLQDTSFMDAYDYNNDGVIGTTILR